MIKLAIRFLLSLCILLLSGYGQLYAHKYKESTSYSPIKNHKESEHASFGTEQYSQGLITKSASSGTKKESFKIDATGIEIEEKELISSEKDLDSSNYFTTIFYVQTPEYFFHYIKSRLAFCKHFSYFSSFRSLYLIFRVFRL